MHPLVRIGQLKLAASLAVIVGLLAAGPAPAAANPNICLLSGPAAAVQAPAMAQPQSPASGIIATPGQAYIHVSAIGNTICNWTDLENPAVNGQPARALLATVNAGPYGMEAASLDHPQGVWYDNSVHRWSLYNEDIAPMTLGRSWNVFIPPPDLTLIWHDSDAGNSFGPLTDIDNLQFNGDPNAIIFVQHVYNAYAPAAGASPQGAPSNYFTKTVGVVYDNVHNKWAIRNEDGSNFQYGKTFWALRASADEAAFTHTVTAGSLLYPFATTLDNPMLNDNPDAQILITQNLDGGVANNNRVAVSYEYNRRWTIQNLDGQPMPVGARFNVLVIPPKTGYMVQEATADNTVANVVYIGPVPFGNPDLNDHPEALVYVTHNWNPPEAPNEMYNNHPIGVKYLNGQWAVVNLDGAFMQQGLTFNVYYTWGRGNSFSASASNTTTSTLRLNNPLLNNSPNAIAIITANLTPAGLVSPTATYTAPVGLRYYGPLSAWQVFNTGPNFVITQTYNVLIPSPGTRFVVTATAPYHNYFEFNNPLTNNNPGALLFVTPRDHGGIYPHNVGVFYQSSSHRWAIFDENTADAMPSGASYDVFVTRLRVYLPIAVK